MQESVCILSSASSNPAVDSISTKLFRHNVKYIEVYVAAGKRGTKTDNPIMPW